MLALSVRQPYAELILRGIKTAELRSRATRVIGERFYLYAAKAKAKPPAAVWSDDLAVGDPPGWMVELARQVKLIPLGAALPVGVIVGSAVIERVERVASCELLFAGQNPLATNNQQLTTLFRWHLVDVERIKTPRKPKRQPQPVWFTPF